MLEPYKKIIVSGSLVEIFTYSLPLQVKKEKERVIYDSLPPKRYQDKSLRARKQFVRLAHANFDGQESPIMISLTYGYFHSDLKQGWKHFNQFVRSMRFRFGSKFKYLAVPEWQSGGRLHFHCMFWFLPHRSRKHEMETRLYKQSWPHGFLDVVETDGSPKLVSYLSKYFMKTFDDPRMNCNQRYTASKNINHPIENKNLTGLQLDYLVAELGDLPKPYKDVSYRTQWLGECVERVYDL